MVENSAYFFELQKKLQQDEESNKNYKKVGEIWFYKGKILLDPKSIVYQQVVFEHHNTPIRGHSGYKRTLHYVRHFF